LLILISLDSRSKQYSLLTGCK